MTEGNRLLDQGEKPGPAALAAWKLADGVLDATTQSGVLEVRAGLSPQCGRPSRPPARTSCRPGGMGLAWARRRLEVKKRRDFPEADRIRALLAEHGFEIRDRKDGSVEVARK